MGVSRVMNRKFVFSLCLLFVTILLHLEANHVFSEVLEHTGTIKVYMPDAFVATFGPHDTISQIPASSTFEIIDGDATIVSDEGTILLVVDGTVASLSEGVSVSVSFDSYTQTAQYTVNSGRLPIIVGPTKVILDVDESCEISINSATRAVVIVALIGNIEAITADISTVVKQDVSAEIKLDQALQKVTIAAFYGDLNVVTPEGKFVVVKDGELWDSDGIKVKRIVAEEPLEEIEDVQELVEPVEELEVNKKPTIKYIQNFEKPDDLPSIVISDSTQEREVLVDESVY